MCRSAGGVQELHCTHRFHKEVRQLVQFTSVACVMSTLSHCYPACQTSDHWCMEAAHSWTRMMWSGMKTTCRKLQYPCRGMGHLSNLVPGFGLLLMMLFPFRWALKGSKEARAESAPQKRWSSIWSGEEAFRWKKKVCRWTDFLGGEEAAHSPSSAFPSKTSLICFSGREGFFFFSFKWIFWRLTLWANVRVAGRASVALKCV